MSDQSSMQECKQGFAPVDLGEIAHIEMGQSPDSRYVFEDPFLGYPFLQGNAEFGTVSPEPKYGCTRPAKTAKSGDVLISVRAPVGAVNIADQSYCIGRGLAAISATSGIEPSLLAHLVASQAAALRRVAQGTTFEAISKKDLVALKLRMPPQGELPVIAQILATLDTAIRETEALIDKLKAVKQGLLHDLLTRGIDANGQLRPPQSEAPQLYKESPLGWVPREWDLTQLGKVAVLQRGYDIVEAKLAPGHFPVISSSGIVGYHNASTSSGPNVVVGRKGSIGTVHYVETDIWAHDTSLFVTNFFGNCEKFVFYLFKYLDLGQYGTKSGSPSLNRNDVHPLPIGRPSLDEQYGIVRILDSQNDEVSRSEQELDKLMKLKSGLMDDLLTGRVRVTPLLESVQQAAAQMGA